MKRLQCALPRGLVVVVGLACWFWPAAGFMAAAVTNAAAPAVTSELAPGQRVLRACQLLQEQMQSALHASAELRRTDHATVQRNMETLIERLRNVEQGLNRQRQQLEEHSMAVGRTTADLQQQLTRQRDLLAGVQRTHEDVQERLLRASLEAAQAQVDLKREAVQRQQLEQQNLAGASAQADLHRKLAELLENNAVLRLVLSNDHIADATWQRERRSLGRRQARAVAELERLRKELETESDRNRRDLAQTQHFTRDLLLIVGTLAAVALLAVAFLCWSQARVNRHSAASFQPHPNAPGPAVAPSAPATAGKDFDVWLGRLQQCLQQFERSIGTSVIAAPAADGGAAPVTVARVAAAPRAAEGSPPPESGSAPASSAAPVPRPGSEPLDTAARVGLVLRKGQTFLDLGHADSALVCFEEALALNPQSAEAWVKRGSALERLQRFDEALGSYDGAITVDVSSTNAHLLKGGLLNRLRRYDEALQCYEQALRGLRKT